MDNLLLHALSVFITFFALYNPISNTAIFFVLSQSRDRHERKRIAVKSIAIAFVILSIFCLIGKSIFDTAAIPVTSFQVVGGLFIIIIGTQMLYREPGITGLDIRKQYENQRDIALYPLAFPLMAGPGAISAAVVFSVTDNNPKIAINLISFAIISVLTYYCFRAVYRLNDQLNTRLLKLSTRIIGVVLIIIGNLIVIDGLQG